MDLLLAQLNPSAQRQQADKKLSAVQIREVQSLYSILFPPSPSSVSSTTSPEALSTLPTPQEHEGTAIEERKKRVDDVLLQQIHRILSQLASSTDMSESPAHPSSFPFKLEVRDSSIPNSGKGVFVADRVPAGQVICFYPGIVYGPDEWFLFSNQILPDNHYLIFDANKFLFDGSDSGTSKKIFQMIYSRERKVSVKDKGDFGFSIFPNPLACAQLVNHPTEPSQANVVSYSIDIPLSWASSNLADYLPNLYWTASAQAKRKWNATKALVFVTRREVFNEELFFDYHFNSNNQQLPTWYKSSSAQPNQKPN